jgi:exosortase
VIEGLASQWWNDPDMGHGFLVPVCIAWIVWRERARWQALTPQPSAWGFALLLAGAAMHVVAAGGAGLFAGSVALVTSVVGAIVALGGTALLRVWAFPLALTAFMLPKLAVVYNQVTLPLQLIATQIAGGMLRVVGVAARIDGNVLTVGGQRVAVEEACSGLRFLLPLGLLAVMLAWSYGRSVWMRWALLAAAVPVAIGANALRVASAAWLAGINPVYAEGMFHELSGVLIFLVCLPALALVSWVLNRIHGRFHAA